MPTRVVLCFVVWTLLPAEYIGAQPLIDGVTTDAAEAVGATQPPPVQREERRPPVLVPLYLSLIALQVADGISTVNAVRHGSAQERNPAMRPFANSHTAMLLIKASSTTATMYAVEKLWRKNRVAAVLTMVGINAVYVAAVANNLRAVR